VIPILITSGKGGVGKTTVAVNLALALLEKGLRVGILDADLMDPVTHLYFKVDPRRIREYGKMLTPITVDVSEMGVSGTIEFMGLGPFIPRGVGVALNYEKAMDFIITLLKFVKWTCGYLVIDTPPSSIDVNVRLLKELESKARAVLVGEPHIFALEDNLRMLDLLRMYHIDVRAIVLNKHNLFYHEGFKDAVEYVEKEYEKLGLKIIRIPWTHELTYSVKPELFKELAEVVVA
jgi:ATP-binding protein involved in chromosome partitioning